MIDVIAGAGIGLLLGLLARPLLDAYTATRVARDAAHIDVDEPVRLS